MKKKILGSMLMISLVAALVGGATFAYFSDSATNSNNSFAAGTLLIDDAALSVSGAWDVTNAYPGMSATKTFTVKNAGSLPFKFTYSMAGTGALFGGDNPSTLTVTDEDGDDQLAPNESAVITAKFAMPDVAGNEYQNAAGTAVLTVNASQINQI